MTQDEAATHWQQRAHAELKVAETLFQSNNSDFYAEVLFHCHLALELGVKAAYIKKHDTPAPFTHNIRKLMSFLEDESMDEAQDAFDQLSEFAILARYGDSKWFATHATKENAEFWLHKTEQFLSTLLP